MNRQDRRAGRAAGDMDQSAFLKLADRFIDVANRENRKVPAPDLQLAFLWAAARYNAFVGKSLIRIDDHEAYVTEMTKTYQEMLRQNLADPSIDPPA
jgi:hypothetical protein